MALTLNDIEDPVLTITKIADGVNGNPTNIHVGCKLVSKTDPKDVFEWPGGQYLGTELAVLYETNPRRVALIVTIRCLERWNAVRSRVEPIIVVTDHSDTIPDLIVEKRDISVEMDDLTVQIADLETVISAGITGAAEIDAAKQFLEETRGKLEKLPKF